MKTLFSNHVFQGDFAPRKLSQASAFNVVTDVLNDFGVSESDIAALIDKMPSGSVAEYRARLKECKEKGITSGEGMACLYRLYQDIKSKDNETKIVPPAPAPKPASFPIVPVAIGAAVLAAVGIYFAVKG